MLKSFEALNCARKTLYVFQRVRRKMKITSNQFTCIQINCKTNYNSSSKYFYYLFFPNLYYLSWFKFAYRRICHTSPHRVSHLFWHSVSRWISSTEAVRTADCRRSKGLWIHHHFVWGIHHSIHLYIMKVFWYSIRIFRCNNYKFNII